MYFNLKKSNSKACVKLSLTKTHIEESIDSRQRAEMGSIAIYEKQIIFCRICKMEHEIQTTWMVGQPDAIRFLCPRTMQSWESTAQA
jgi:hypothetical protein